MSAGCVGKTDTAVAAGSMISLRCGRFCAASGGGGSFRGAGEADMTGYCACHLGEAASSMNFQASSCLSFGVPDAMWIEFDVPPVTLGKGTRATFRKGLVASGAFSTNAQIHGPSRRKAALP